LPKFQIGTAMLIQERISRVRIVDFDCQKKQVSFVHGSLMEKCE
jgi:hypothetical protein